ncbi:TPA: hypothetical protein ACHU8X_001464 [Enterococcus faecalis]
MGQRFNEKASLDKFFLFSIPEKGIKRLLAAFAPIEKI